MSEDEVRALVFEAIKPFQRGITATGFTDWCRANGVTLSHASQFMNRKRDAPGSDLLAALGLEWRIVPKEHDEP